MSQLRTRLTDAAMSALADHRAALVRDLRAALASIAPSELVSATVIVREDYACDCTMHAAPTRSGEGKEALDAVSLLEGRSALAPIIAELATQASLESQLERVLAELDPLVVGWIADAWREVTDETQGALGFAQFEGEDVRISLQSGDELASEEFVAFTQARLFAIAGVPAPVNADPRAVDHDTLLRQTFAAREKLYASWGQLDDHVLAPAVNPSLTGGPSWPALRQAYRQLRRGRGHMFITDGLSDPFETNGPANGFGLELIIETDEPVTQPTRSWALDIVVRAAEMVAGHGGTRALIEEMGLLSFELEAVNVPSGFRARDGRTGVVLGIPAPGLPERFSIPGGDVLMVTVKLLAGSELELVRAHGEEGRRELARRFALHGTHHVSSTRRPSVV